MSAAANPSRLSKITDHPRYIEISTEGGLGNWRQLRISLDVGKFDPDHDITIEAFGSYNLERNQVIESFVDKVLQFCFMLKRRKEGMERAIEETKEEQKRHLKEHGYVTTDSIREIENYKEYILKHEVLYHCLMHVLDKDKSFLDKIRI